MGESLEGLPRRDFGSAGVPRESEEGVFGAPLSREGGREGGLATSLRRKIRT